MRPAVPILWDVVEEHLDEAAFLSSVWEGALASPRYTAAEIASGPEARLAAHVEGLVTAGPAARERLLEPELASDEPERAFAAALALLEGSSPDAVEAVLHALEATPARAAPLQRALELSRRPGLEKALQRGLAMAEGPALAVVLCALSFRRAEIPEDRLRAWLASPEPELVAAALIAARFCGPRLYPLVMRQWEDGPAAVREAALATGLALGARPALLACRKLVEARDPAVRFPLLALAISGDRVDARRLLGCLEVEALRPAALFALGFTGRAEVAEACLPLLADEALGPVAAEAFSAITGLAIEAEYRRRPPPAEEEARDAEEAEDLEADLSAGPEAELPRPEPEAVARWWAANRGQLDPDRRFLAGKPFGADGLLAAFAGGPARRRPGLLLELALRSRGAYDLEARDWCERQIQVQARWTFSARQVALEPLDRLLRG